MSSPVSIGTEGRLEVRLLGAAVTALLVVAYLSWTKKESKVSGQKVMLVEVAPEQLDRVTLITRTQTVTVEKRRLGGGDPLLYFSVDAAGKKRGFLGNKATKQLFESFAPFAAVRGLGSSMTTEQLKEAKLDRPESKLVLATKGGDRTFDIGGRSYGARDWYVRPKGGTEVALVSSRQLGDLEFPEGRFMQRQLLNMEVKDISSAVLKAGAKEKRMLHQNRLSEADAYWADAAAPEIKDEAIGNYVAKVQALAATSYLEADAVKGATKVLELVWEEGETPKETLTLYRVKDGNAEKYLAVSTATVLPVEVPRSSAEQLEQDLTVLLEK